MQRYKVFINEHLILIDEKFKKNEINENLLSIQEPNSNEIGLIINWLFDEKVKTIVSIKSENVLAMWQNFIDHFTFIHAAGGKVFNESDEVLVIYRLNTWDLPKGKVEDNESFEEAALREVQEECGLVDVQIQSELPSTFHVYKLKEKLILKETHWYTMKSAGKEILKPQIEEDIQKVEWLSQEKLRDLADETYASLKDLFLPQ